MLMLRRSQSKEVKTNKSIVNSVLSVSSIIIIAKLLGFVKQIIIAGTFGATIETDLLSLSQNVIGDLEYLLVQVFLTAFIPIYLEVKKKGRDESNRFVTNALTAWLMIAVFAVISLELLSPVVARIIAPSYQGDLHSRLVQYIRIYSPTIIIMIICAVFNALLRGNNRFVPGELINVIQSITLIGLTLLFRDVFGIKILIVAFFTYNLINMGYLIITSHNEWKFSRKGSIFDDNIRKLVSMSLPMLLGYSMIFVNQQVDKIIVSGLGDGVVTSVGYAAVLVNLVTTLTGSTVSVIFTYISRNVAEGKDQEAANLVRRSMVLFTTALVPICVLIIMNSSDIVRIVYGRGAFSDAAIRYTSYALIGYGFTVVVYAYRELFSRVHYSYQDSRRPMINSSIGICCNIVLSVVLSKYIGVLGVTLASSISVCISAVLNIAYSGKHNSFISLSRVLVYLPWWIVGAVICVVVSRTISRFTISNPLIRFSITSIVSVLLYGIACIPLFMNNSISLKNN